VIIHHKFIVIDAEGENPVIYTGSANMSNNTEHNNDENLIELKNQRIAAIYLAGNSQRCVQAVTHRVQFLTPNGVTRPGANPRRSEFRLPACVPAARPRTASRHGDVSI
jgi:phosphatidylserine/phosphatidylglycerophosphate/cardiolipin synthase-like enzyme